MPQERGDRAHADGAERSEHRESFDVRKDAEGAKRDDEESSGKSVEAVGEVYGVRGPDEDEDEDRHVPRADEQITVEGDIDACVAEFPVEPEGTERADEKQAPIFGSASSPRFLPTPVILK